VFVYEIFHITDRLVQVVVPGSKDLKFDRPGANTVFLEEESTVNGKIYSTSSSAVSGLKCDVHAQDGSEINIRRPGGSTTYEVSGRRGRSVLEFYVPKAGTYHFQCAYEEGKSGPEAVIAVGSGVTTAILVSLAAVFIGFGVGTVLGAVTFVIIYKRQRRSRVVYQNQPVVSV
jgi:hypothetical protein